MPWLSWSSSSDATSTIFYSSIDALYSFWVVWALYLAHYTGFQAFGLTHSNMTNRNSWITVFFL
jgi:hypothetical protein